MRTTAAGTFDSGSAGQPRFRVDAEVPIKCPGCGQQRLVAGRTWRRIRAGQASGRCEDCRTPPAVVVVGERERAWAMAFLASLTPGERIAVRAAFTPRE